MNQDQEKQLLQCLLQSILANIYIEYEVFQDNLQEIFKKDESRDCTELRLKNIQDCFFRITAIITTLAIADVQPKHIEGIRREQEIAFRWGKFIYGKFSKELIDIYEGSQGPKALSEKCAGIISDYIDAATAGAFE